MKKHLKKLAFLSFLFLMAYLFTYTSLDFPVLIPYSFLILIEYSLFVKKDK